MSLVTRLLNNEGDPVCYPDGSVAANKTITFQLVDFEKRQPISLFDAISGEYVAGGLRTATINASGYFTISLWPNNRGESATVYKVALPGLTAKPFYIQITEGDGAQSLLSAKAAVDAVAPQTLSLFDALLANIIEVVNTATSTVTRTVNGLMSWQDKVKLDDLVIPDVSDLVPGTRTVNGHDLSADVTITKADLNLENIDNTSDANKPVSTAQQNALNQKAPLASPSFTGRLVVTNDNAAGLTVNITSQVVTARNWAVIGSKYTYGDLAILQSSTLGGDPVAGVARLCFGYDGSVLVGTTTSNGVDKLQVAGSASFSGNIKLNVTTAIYPTSNWDVSFYATANNVLWLTMKGGDGVVRSVALTLT